MPYVIETSIGVDRMFLSVMAGSYCEEQLPDGETRVVLRLPAALAPVKLAILPLVKKDGLPEKAREIMDMLRFDFKCQYDEKDSIGNVIAVKMPSVRLSALRSITIRLPIIALRYVSVIRWSKNVWP